MSQENVLMFSSSVVIAASQAAQDDDHHRQAQPTGEAGWEDGPRESKQERAAVLPTHAAAGTWLN